MLKKIISLNSPQLRPVLSVATITTANDPFRLAENPELAGMNGYLEALVRDSKDAMRIFSEWHRGDYLAFKKLLTTGNSHGITPLHLMALTGNLGAIESTLRALADPQNPEASISAGKAILAKTDRGITPLHIALYRRDFKALGLFEAYMPDDFDSVLGVTDEQNRNGTSFAFLAPGQLFVSGSQLVVSDSQDEAKVHFPAGNDEIIVYLCKHRTTMQPNYRGRFLFGIQSDTIRSLPDIEIVNDHEIRFRSDVIWLALEREGRADPQTRVGHARHVELPTQGKNLESKVKTRRIGPRDIGSFERYFAIGDQLLNQGEVPIYRVEGTESDTDTATDDDTPSPAPSSSTTSGDTKRIRLTRAATGFTGTTGNI